MDDSSGMNGSYGKHVDKLLKGLDPQTRQRVRDVATTEFDAAIDEGNTRAHSHPTQHLGGIYTRRIDAEEARKAEQSDDPAVRASAYPR